jgi:hypothetical protein
MGDEAPIRHIHCDISCNRGVCFGAYVVIFDGEISPIRIRRLEDKLNSTDAEMLFMEQAVLEQPPDALVHVHHDVRQLDDILNKQRKARWNKLRSLRATNRVVFLYHPRGARSREYVRCHYASNEAARRACRGDGPKKTPIFIQVRNLPGRVRRSRKPL